MNHMWLHLYIWFRILSAFASSFLFHLANLRLLFDKFLLKIVEEEEMCCWFYLSIFFKATCSLTFLHLLKSQPGNLRSVKKYSLYKNLTALLIGAGRMVLLYQNDPSKRLCFIFDLIVSLLTGTFINSLMVNQKLAAWVLFFFLIPGFWIYFIRMPLPNGRVEEGGNVWRATYLGEWRNKENLPHPGWWYVCTGP